MLWFICFIFLQYGVIFCWCRYFPHICMKLFINLSFFKKAWKSFRAHRITQSIVNRIFTCQCPKHVQKFQKCSQFHLGVSLILKNYCDSWIRGYFYNPVSHSNMTISCLIFFLFNQVLQPCRICEWFKSWISSLVGSYKESLKKQQFGLRPHLFNNLQYKMQWLTLTLVIFDVGFQYLSISVRSISPALSVCMTPGINDKYPNGVPLGIYKRARNTGENNQKKRPWYCSWPYLSIVRSYCRLHWISMCNRKKQSSILLCNVSCLNWVKLATTLTSLSSYPILYSI